MELEKRITFHPEVCGGRPCIRGMRIRVSDILEMLGQGVSEAESRFGVEASSLRDLDLHVVWQVVTRELPPLKTQIEALAAKPGQK